MKTTNKILLAAFLIVLLVVIAFMIYLRVNISVFKVVEGSGNVVRQYREVPDFQSVQLRGNLKAYFVQDADYQINIEADDNLMDLVVTEINNGQLSVYLEKPVRRGATLNLYIHAANLEALHVSAGSKAYSDKPLTGSSFEHNVQAGAKSTLHLQYDNMELKVQAGAITILEGRVGTLTVLSAAGAIVDAKELVVRDCEIDAKAGSVNNLFVTGTLSGSVTRGAVIHYAGDPVIADLDVKTGGHVEVKAWQGR